MAPMALGLGLGATFGGGIPSLAAMLLAAETDGIAADFTDMSMVVKDTATPANAFSGDPNSKLTYSSPSTKWILGSNGLYSSGTTLRTEYNTSGVALGCRIEEARTNLCLRNRDFTNASWIKQSATAARTATGADGVASAASRLTATASNGVAFQNISSASAARSSSLLVKRATGSGVVTISQGNTTGSTLITNGAFTSDITGWTAYGTSLPTLSHTGSALLVTNTGTTALRGAYQAITCTVGKLYRVTATLTASSGTIAARLYAGTSAPGQSNLGSTSPSVGTPATFCFYATATTVYISLNDQGTSGTSTLTWDDVSVFEVAETDITAQLNTSTYVRVSIDNETITNPCVIIKMATSGDAVDVDFAQQEVGAFVTSPIETAGSTVTRAADNISIATSLFPYSATASTLFNKVLFTSRTLTANAYMGALSDGTISNRILAPFFSSGAVVGSYRVTNGGAASIATNGGGNFVSVSVNKSAVAVQVSDFAAYRNGASDLTSAAAVMPTGVNKLSVGCGEAGTGNQFNGHVQQVMYLPRRMSNGDMGTLTT